MKKNLQIKVLLTLVALFSLISVSINAQRVSVDADSYNQEFVGTGASCGLYIGQYLSMWNSRQLEASRMLYEDLKLNFVKDYTGETPTANPDYYDKISTFINNAKVYNPDVKVVICVHNLPDELEIGYGTDQHEDHEYDPNIPDIFDKIAEYYFQVCKGYYDRGNKVDILELVNERGYDDGKATNLYDIAAGKFKDLINDATYNTTHVPMPLIAGPATWSAASPETFINGWKAERPKAWLNVDIVTTHAYQNGTEANHQITYSLCDGRPFYLSEQTGKLQLDEDPGVDPIAEQFPDAGYYPVFVANASIARFMIDFFNAGGNAFFAFLTNNPHPDHNAALLYTKWNGAPYENAIYNGFKHLSSTQPLHSKKVDRDLTNMDNYRVVAFRKEGEADVYVHVLNMYNTYEQVTIDFKGEGIKSVQGWRTDEFLDFGEVENVTYPQALSEIVVNTTPYSVSTYKVTLEGSSTTALQTQTITFGTLSDKLEADNDFELSATASSGLPVSFEILRGPAMVSGNTVSLTGIGKVKIRAKQEGNDSYYTASPVDREFYVRSQGENVALNKPAKASSQYSTTKYFPTDAVDGNISDNASRWITSKTALFTVDNPEWIEIDLQGSYEINALGMYVGLSGYNNPIHEFEFQVWNGSDWQTVLSEVDNFDPTYLKSFSPVTTSKVRLYMTGAPDGYFARIYELEVYGTYQPTGIFDAVSSKKKNVKVYPNPVNNKLFLDGINENGLLEIRNTFGTLVKKVIYNQGVDVSDLPKGIYILTYDSDYQAKFVKE